MPAERECRAYDGWNRHTVELSERGDDPRGRNQEAAGAHGVAEELAVLRTPDDVDLRAEQLDVEVVEHSGLRELDREVECRLTSEHREQRVWTLSLEHRR